QVRRKGEVGVSILVLLDHALRPCQSGQYPRPVAGFDPCSPGSCPPASPPCRRRNRCSSFDPCSPGSCPPAHAKRVGEAEGQGVSILVLLDHALRQHVAPWIRAGSSDKFRSLFSWIMPSG